MKQSVLLVLEKETKGTEENRCGDGEGMLGEWMAYQMLG
jgi:hypothetical protein